MLTIIRAVQVELRAKLPYIRDADIYIAPSVYSINSGVKFPCIGIKDGRPESMERAGGVVEWTLPIHCSVFVKLAKDAERAIIGDDATLRPGVLEIAGDICDALSGNLLGLAVDHGLQAAMVTGETASEMFVDPQSNGIQRIQVTITYTRETSATCGGG